jgi:hypothetical protein
VFQNKVDLVRSLYTQAQPEINEVNLSRILLLITIKSHQLCIHTSHVDIVLKSNLLRAVCD